MNSRKLLAIILLPAALMLLAIRCSDDEAITYSLSDVSSRVSGFNNPKTGPGAELTINGSQLQNVQRIFIGTQKIAARDFTSHTESGITFTVPTSATPNTNGEKTRVLIVFSGSERAFREIEVVRFQAISSFTPFSAAAGETVTLLGVNFDLVTGVKLGGVDATITSQTPGVLKFTMPVGAPTGRITLVSDAGNSSSASDLVSCSGGDTDCAPGLNQNFGFEEGSGDDFTGWTKNNGANFIVATTVPGEVFRGARGVKVVRDGSLGTGQWRIQMSSNLVATEPGASYTVYMWVRAAATGGALRVSLSPDTGFYPADVAVTTAWQRISFVVPGTRVQNASTRFVLDMNGNNTAVTTFFIDDVKIIKN